MTMRRSSTLVAAAFLAAAVATVQAQMGHQPGSGMGMSQDHMRQMQDMMQRMNGVMHQTHQMSQDMQHHMQNHHGEMMEQHRMMQRMDDCVGNMAEHLRMTMEQHDKMMKDAALMRDAEMQQDMAHLREHMGTMTEQLEKSLAVLQRMNQRVAPPAAKE